MDDRLTNALRQMGEAVTTIQGQRGRATTQVDQLVTGAEALVAATTAAVTAMAEIIRRHEEDQNGVGDALESMLTELRGLVENEERDAERADWVQAAVRQMSESATALNEATERLNARFTPPAPPTGPAPDPGTTA